MIRYSSFEVIMTTSNADIPQGVVQVNELVSIDGVITLPEVIYCMQWHTSHLFILEMFFAMFFAMTRAISY